MLPSLLKAIRITGSRKNLASTIGTTTDAINGWLNRGIQVPLQYAFEIERVTLGEIRWTEIAPHLAHYSKRWEDFFCCNNSSSIPVIHIALSNVKCNCLTKPCPHTLYALSVDIKQNGLKQPICVSTENDLIFGARRLGAYKMLDIETIPAWRISLGHLLEGKYSKIELSQIFNLSQRIAISLALEQVLGNRRGRRKKDLNGENYPHLKGRTDQILAHLLGLGNPKTYQQAKRICQKGCYELIDATHQKRIAISSAALLTQFTPSQQKYILTRSHKEIASYISQLRIQKNHLNLMMF